MNILCSEPDDIAHPDLTLRCRAMSPTEGGARCQSRAGLNGFCRVHEGPTVGTPDTARRRRPREDNAANGLRDPSASDACALPWQVLMWKIRTIRRLFDLGATPAEARCVMSDLPLPTGAAALTQEALAMIDILTRNLPEQLAADRTAEAEHARLARDAWDGEVDDQNAARSDAATPLTDLGVGDPDSDANNPGQRAEPNDVPRSARRRVPVHGSGRPECRHQVRVMAPRRQRGGTAGPTDRRRRDMRADHARPRAPRGMPRVISTVLPHVCRETALVSGQDRTATKADPTRRNNPNQPTDRHRRDMRADTLADHARSRAPRGMPRVISTVLPHVCRETALDSGQDRTATEADPIRRNNPNQPTDRHRRNMRADALADHAHPRAPRGMPRAIHTVLPLARRETDLVSRPDRTAADTGSARRSPGPRLTPAQQTASRLGGFVVENYRA